MGKVVYSTEVGHITSMLKVARGEVTIPPTRHVL